MLFSFTTFAVSLWLGLVAVACFRRLWRVAPNEGGGHGTRDYPRATGGENHHRQRDLTSEGPISVGCRSLVMISRAVVSVIQTGLTRAFQWISRTFRASELSQDSVSPLPAPAVEDSNSALRSRPHLQSGGSVVSIPPNGTVGAARRKPTKCGASEAAEPQLASAAQRLRKNDNRRTEKVATRVSKLRKDQSEKKSQKINTVVAKTAKKTVRCKRKISSAANSLLASKVSV
jgi:hypothetical protein